ncbi:hypothetical protein, partial [Marispirochaeta aestuarii]|uniref:hypothetical protein n=1 Tax=Marispirochaeta aestuarii TaxID=1963862 RepID=UPI0011782FA2
MTIHGTFVTYPDLTNYQIGLQIENGGISQQIPVQIKNGGAFSFQIEPRGSIVFQRFVTGGFSPIQIDKTLDLEKTVKSFDLGTFFLFHPPKI